MDDVAEVRARKEIGLVRGKSHCVSRNSIGNSPENVRTRSVDLDSFSSIHRQVDELSCY